MSSSKSIAAARARRSAEPPQQQAQRPGTSISSAKAFSQQQQQPPQKPPQQQNYSQPGGKISISDAIGLITIRLGRVELYLNQNHEEGGINMNSNIPDNAQLVDKSVITNIISRIDSVEKRDNTNVANKLEKEIKEIKDLLANTIFKFDEYVANNEKRFNDIDMAFVELEKGLVVSSDNDELNNTIISDNLTDLNSSNIQLIIEENKPAN